MNPTAIRFTLVSFLVLGFAAPASAQHLSLTPPAAPDRDWRFSGRWDTYAFGGGVTSPGLETRETSWANAISGQFDLGFVVARLSIPFAYFDVTTTTPLGSSSQDTAQLGNISLEGLANIDLGHPDHRLLIGGGFALPTATDQVESDATNLFAMITRQVAWRTSFREAAAWTDNAFTIWPSIEYRYAGEWVLFTASGAIPFFFPTNSRVGGPLLRGNVEVMFTTDITGAVRLIDAIDIGGSFLAWALPSGAGEDNSFSPGGGFGAGGGQPDLGQTALTLFVRTDEALDFPVGGGFEMIFNLDNGWGPTGEANRVWGAHIFLTAKLDG